MRSFIRIATVLAWNDVRRAYRRSKLGQYWITLGMALQISTISVVFSLIFKISLVDYIPFLAVSLIMWNFIANSLIEGSNSLIESSEMIKQVPFSPVTYVLKTQIRNIIVLGHNAILIPITMLIVGWAPNTAQLLLPVGLILLILNLLWISFVVSAFSARFRDLPPIISAAVTALFYLTPVMWSPDLIGDSVLAHFLLGLNPFYHLFQIVRQPILGNWPTPENWLISILACLIGCLIAVFVQAKVGKKIPYWV